MLDQLLNIHKWDVHGTLEMVIDKEKVPFDVKKEPLDVGPEQSKSRLSNLLSDLVRCPEDGKLTIDHHHNDAIAKATDHDSKHGN